MVIQFYFKIKLKECVTWENPYQMNLDQSSQRIPSIIADRIQSPPEVQDLLLQLVLPNHIEVVKNKDNINISEAYRKKET